MKRVSFGVLYGLISLIAGPLSFMAATFVIFNAGMWLVRWIAGALDEDDISFLPNLIAVLVAAGVIWLLVKVSLWVWRRVLPSDEERAASFDKSWMIAGLSLLSAAVIVNLALAYIVNSIANSPSYDWDTFMALTEPGASTTARLALSGMYMPLAWGTFIIGVSGLETQRESSRLSAACLIVPAVVLIAWTVLQGISGNIF